MTLEQERAHAAGFLAWVAGSLAVHIGAAGVLAWAIDADALAHAATEQRDNPPEVGIERSDHVTLTWIGFEQPTPHDAPKAKVDQPFETRDAAPSSSQGMPKSDEPSPEASEAVTETVSPEPSTESPEDEPRSPAATEPSESQVADDSPASETDGRALPSGEALPIAPLSERLGLRSTRPDRGLGAPADGSNPDESPQKPRPEAQAPPSDEQLQARPAQGRPDADPERPSPTTAPARSAGSTPDARTGDVSDRESDPSAQDPPIEFTPGRPVAAEGLTIRTRVPPRHSIVTRLVSLASRPVFELSFRRDGTVAWVRTVRSSGDPDVDGPWINALYQWRATGEALDRLDPADPDAMVRRTFELVPIR